MRQSALSYQTLEKLRLSKPVDRLKYIAQVSAGKYVLDVGCFDETALQKRDTPHWLHGRLLESARRVIGLDISDKIPEGGIVSGENGLILKRDAANLDLSEISAADIEVIVAGEFIEHIENPSAFLRRVKHEFSGRQLLISTPNGASFANALMGMVGREAQHPDHLHSFTYKTLNTLCLRAGFVSWEIIPYRFFATEMIMASSGPRKNFVKFVQSCIRGAEIFFLCFPSAILFTPQSD